MACTVTLASCGGGGGSTPGSQPTPVPTPTPTPSVSGDMLAATPSRGWNYQGGGLTVSVYTNPTAINGVTALTAAAVLGTVPTVLTTASNVYANLAGAIGIIPTANGDQIVSELSAGGAGAVPGSPILAPNTLTLGQTFTPYTGVTATVVSIGTVPGASACPTPANGATVQYVFQQTTRTISYVPGCGITQVVNGTATFTLSSVGTYATLGQLAHARRVASLNLADTARSLLGLNRSELPGAHLFK